MIVRPPICFQERWKAWPWCVGLDSMVIAVKLSLSGAGVREDGGN